MTAEDPESAICGQRSSRWPSQSAWCNEVGVSQTHLEAADILKNLQEATASCPSQWQ